MNFHKQKKQPVKWQHLDTAFLKIWLFWKDILHKFNHGEYYISMTQLNFFYSLSQYKLNQAIGLNLVAIEWISILLFF